MMHILLTGAKGQLGWELQRSLSTLGAVTAVDFPAYDLAQPERLLDLARQLRPQVIVNPAAYTDVDKAEQDSDLAAAVNGAAPGLLAELAKEIGAALIHYSTDYVFNGALGRPYTEQDAPDPLNVYGRSKLAGERAVQQVGGAYLILRTSWLYSLRGSSFVNKVLRWARSNTSLQIVADQVSNPTWARSLAEATGQLLARAGGAATGAPTAPAVGQAVSLSPGALTAAASSAAVYSGGRHPAEWLHQHSGVYHLAAPNFASRYEWAKAILQLDPHPEEQVAQQVLPASSESFPTPALRPKFSALACSLFASTFGLQLPTWEEMLRLSVQP
jgi:dTDP-4-dehydrorhamnose reductase